MAAVLHVLCGLTGAGKTTLAKQLEASTGAIRLCPDEWLEDLGLDPFRFVPRDAIERRLLKLAETLLLHHVSVIVEYGFWARAERDALRLLGSRTDAEVELYYLDVPDDELWRRLQVRNTQPGYGIVAITDESMLLRWSGIFERPDAAEMSLFDRHHHLRWTPDG